MDAYKDALKRKMESMKSPVDHATEDSFDEAQMLKAKQNEGHSDLHGGDAMLEDDDSDMAPDRDILSLKGPSGKGVDLPMTEGDDVHMQILEGLSDSGHKGRGGMSLHERAADGARGKMDMINKMKMAKR